MRNKPQSVTFQKETNTMHIIQEQHAIYFGYAFLGVLGTFYRNRKGLKVGYEFFQKLNRDQYQNKLVANQQ